MFRGGALKFKNGLKKAKVKSHHKARKEDESEQQRTQLMEKFKREVLGFKDNTEEEAENKHGKNEPEFIIQPIENGEGTILISHTTVHGFKTNFQDKLQIGDTIIVCNPEKEGEEERRKITMVLSNKSIGIEEPFSFVPELKIEYKYQKKPIEIPPEEIIQQKLNKRKRELKEEEKNKAEKKYTIVEVRERTGMWGYKTKKLKVKGDLSREEILQIRQKADAADHWAETEYD